MDELNTLLSTLAGAVQDLQADTRANARDLKMLAARTAHMDETLTVVASSVGGLGSILERSLNDQATDRLRLDAVEKRLDVLERRPPPAA